MSVKNVPNIIVFTGNSIAKKASSDLFRFTSMDWYIHGNNSIERDFIRISQLDGLSVEGHKKIELSSFCKKATTLYIFKRENSFATILKYGIHLTWKFENRLG